MDGLGSLPGPRRSVCDGRQGLGCGGMAGARRCTAFCVAELCGVFEPRRRGLRGGDEDARIWVGANKGQAEDLGDACCGGAGVIPGETFGRQLRAGEGKEGGGR